MTPRDINGSDAQPC